AHLGELLLVCVGIDLPIGNRRELDAPALAPARLVGEKPREELDEVTVARAREHAEPLEERQLDLVVLENVAFADAARKAHGLFAQTCRKRDRRRAETVGIGNQRAEPIEW